MRITKAISRLVLFLMMVLPAACAAAEESSLFSRLAPPTKIPVEFSVKVPGADRVNWASEVNDWSPDSHPMSGQDGTGTWKIKIDLPPGIYQYKYVADGSRWMLDPTAPRVINGEYVNSLAVVGTTVERVGMEAYRDARMRSHARALMSGGGAVTGYGSLYRPLKFCVIGDNRDNPDVYRWILNAAASARPRFIANTGDIVGHPSEDGAWRDYLAISRAVDVPQFVAWGNHEFKGRKWIPMLCEFVDHPGNELYYAFQVENALFVFLNTELPRQVSRIAGDQLAWLKTVLEGNTAEHLFVFLHRPLFAAPHGKHCGDCLDSRPEDLAPVVELLRENGVTGVFTGHDHLYDRTRRQGITQVIAGGAGAPLYAPENKGGFYHYVEVTVDGPEVTARTWGSATPNGKLKIKDEFTLSK